VSETDDKDWLKDYPHSIEFIVEHVELHVEESTDSPPQRAVSMRLKLAEGDVRLPNKGHTLKQAAWSLYLREDLNPAKETPFGAAIGYLAHSPSYRSDYDSDPERCSFDASIAPQRLSALIGALQMGRLPRSVTLAVNGMEMGWEPDGSGLEWDVERYRRLPLRKVHFAVPLASRMQTEDPDEEALPVPATGTDVLAVTTAIQTTSQRVAAQLVRSTWIIVAAVIIAAWAFRG
jgi:hypothetical protein